MSDENVPMDAIAEAARAIIEAAIIWRWTVKNDSKMTREEWRLYEACGEYGSEYRGLRAE